VGQVRWTAEAFYWLETIYDYIAEDRPEAARKVIDGIVAKVETLEVFPERGYSFENVRILLYGHYRIAYLILGPERDVEILGIYHGALNLKERLSPTPPDRESS
jgi:toxin ParE1/3/4